MYQALHSTDGFATLGSDLSSESGWLVRISVCSLASRRSVVVGGFSGSLVGRGGCERLLPSNCVLVKWGIRPAPSQRIPGRRPQFLPRYCDGPTSCFCSVA